MSSGFKSDIFSSSVAYSEGIAPRAPAPFLPNVKLRLRQVRLRAAETIFRPPN